LGWVVTRWQMQQRKLRWLPRLAQSQSLSQTSKLVLTAVSSRNDKGNGTWKPVINCVPLSQLRVLQSIAVRRDFIPQITPGAHSCNTFSSLKRWKPTALLRLWRFAHCWASISFLNCTKASTPTISHHCTQFLAMSLLSKMFILSKPLVYIVNCDTRYYHSNLVIVDIHYNNNNNNNEFVRI
jgi:hypothetical protein